jgi:hypothetical protein
MVFGEVVYLINLTGQDEYQNLKRSFDWTELNWTYGVWKQQEFL